VSNKKKQTCAPASYNRQFTPYLVLLRKVKKVILERHADSDQYQNLITSRGSALAHRPTSQVWSTSIDVFVSYLELR